MMKRYVRFSFYCRRAELNLNRGAVRADRIFEVKSTYILQPGPASLTEGVRQLHDILAGIHLTPRTRS